MIDSIVAGVLMFIVGAVLAVIINFYLLPYFEDVQRDGSGKRRPDSDQIMVMGWIARFFLWLLPLFFAGVGAGLGSKVLESVR